MAALSSRVFKCQWFFAVCRRITFRRGRIGSCSVVFIVFALIWGVLFGTTAYSQFMPPIPNQPQQQGRNIGPFPPQAGPQGMMPGRNQPRGSGEQLPRIEASGTIEVLTPVGLQIVTPSGQKWQLAVSRECKIELTGKALPDVLRPGVIVSFTASIEKKTGHATEKVESLVICSIDQNHQLGVFPDQGTGATGDAPAFGEMGGVGSGPAASPFGAAAGGFGNLGGPAERPTRPGRGRQNPEDDVPVERYQVCGRISAITKLGKITVVAPNPHFRAPIQIEVGENPDISLELSGGEAMAFIRPGAKITGKGVQIGPTAARMSELMVELTEPVTFAAPKKEKEQPGEQDKPHPRSNIRTPTNHAAEDKQPAGETTEKPAQEGNHGEKSEQAAPADQNPPPKAAGIELPPLP